MLFPESGLALLAVSGGPDSVAMLDLFAGLSTELGLELVVGHVDHGIAPESRAVADAVRALAERYDVPCHVATLALGADSSETEAREARYSELRSIQQECGAKYLLTGHHLDDQAETVLYRLLKGTGIAGLAGIPQRGPDGLVRPLLPFRKRELEDWGASAAALGGVLRVYQDPANEDPRHDRSWLRHSLWPIAVARFGDELADRLGDVARSARQEREAWAALLRAVPEVGFRTERNAVTLARVPLQRYDNVLSEALLRALAREAGCLLGFERAKQLLDFVRSGQSGRVMELGQGWEAELSFERVRLLQTPAIGQPAMMACGEGTEGAVSWGGWGFTWQAELAGKVARREFETWVTPGAMNIRGAQPGDRLNPLGGVGGRKIRRLLMEERVPFRERSRFPIIVRGDQVLWVPGVCRSSTAVPNQGEAAVRIVARPPRDG
jgi:tRNA(Ile)-lysidine synthase